jgi:glycerol uptake facilitator protein
MLGGIVVYLHFLPLWRAPKDKAVKLGVLSTCPAIPHIFSNMLSEFIGTAVILVGLLSIGANDFTEGLNPLIVGFLIVAIGLSLFGQQRHSFHPAWRQNRKLKYRRFYHGGEEVYHRTRSRDDELKGYSFQ